MVLCCVIEGLCSAERPMNSPESDTHTIQKKEREKEKSVLFYLCSLTKMKYIIVLLDKPHIKRHISPQNHKKK